MDMTNELPLGLVCHCILALSMKMQPRSWWSFKPLINFFYGLYIGKSKTELIWIIPLENNRASSIHPKNHMDVNAGVSGSRESFQSSRCRFNKLQTTTRNKCGFIYLFIFLKSWLRRTLVTYSFQMLTLFPSTVILLPTATLGREIEKGISKVLF